MRTKRINAKLKFISYRTMAFLMSLMMLLSIVDISSIITNAVDTTGGFSLTLRWNDSSQTESSFVDISEKDEDRLVRLMVSYSHDDVVADGYAPGDITITVPGLKGAVREGTSYIPSYVTADKDSDSAKRYDWSYTYDSKSDTLTFTNNVTIEQNSTFEGSFEILWSLPSRKTKHGFSTTLEATLETAKNETAASNQVSYSQQRKKDEYTLSNTGSGTVSAVSAQYGLLPSGCDENGYDWVKYNVYGTDTYYARDVEGSERFELWFLEDAYVYGAGLTKTNRIKEVGGKNYICWTVTADITKDTSPFLKDIYVAYPKKYRSNSENVNTYVYLYGTYYEEPQEEELANELARTTLIADWAGLDFSDLPGDIYDAKKYSYGTHGGSISQSAVDGHCDQCKEYGAVKAEHLSGKNSDYEYYSDLALLLNFHKEEYEYHDLEFVDDIMDIVTNDSVRQLTDDEYNFTKVIIPSAKNVRTIDGGGIQTNKYQVEIYLRRKGETEGTFTRYNGETTYYVTGSEQTVTLPDDTVGVKVIVRNVQESFQEMDVRVYYKFHSVNTDVENATKVTNFMYFKLYGKPVGGEYQWINDIFTEQNYLDDYDSSEQSYAKDIYDRDVRIYGGALDRESFSLHVIPIYNEFRTDTVINLTKEDDEAYYFDGKVDVGFTLGENNTLSNFSTYVIVPEGMAIQPLYNDAEKLKDALTFVAYGGFTADYIKEHATVQIMSKSGRQYIKVSYDFTDSPITTTLVSVRNIPLYYLKYQTPYVSKTLTLPSITLIDQTDGNWYGTDKDNISIDSGIWSDIDGDSDSEEYAAYSTSNVTVYSLTSGNVQFTKFVKTDHTNGYVQPRLDGDSYIADEVPYTYCNSEYSYKLRVISGSNNSMKNIVFVDNIETGPRKQWQGTFAGVDTTYAESVLGTKASVYYSSSEADTTQKPDLTDSAWTLAESWTKALSEVKAVAVDFGDSMLKPNYALYVEIYMTAPNDESLYDQITENGSNVYYDKYDADGTGSAIAGDLSSNYVPVSLSPMMGRIRIIKRDPVTKERLDFAVFTLYKMLGDAPNTATDNIVQDNITTDAIDNVEVMVPYGKYYLVETQAPTGYTLDANPIQIELNKELHIQEIINERKKGTFKLRKVSDKDSVPVAGAKFAIYSSVDDSVVRQDLVTGESGRITVEDLEWGSYYAKETQAPTGYELYEQKIEFEIASDKLTASATVTEKHIPCTVELVKTEVDESGASTNVPVDGAEYELYNSSGICIGTYTTDANGKITVEDLNCGTYYFKESSAAKGYALNSEKITFSFSDSDYDSTKNIYLKTVETTDNRLLGSVLLTKLDDANNPVVGAKYALYNAATNQQVDVTGQASDTAVFTTGYDGTVTISGLYWGEYYIKETEPPVGYDLNSTEYPVTISRETVNTQQTVAATDTRKTGSVELTKVAAENENQKLAGAVYTLYRNDGTVCKDDLITSANGTVTVENLTWGSYYFLEKTPPENFSLSDEKIRFTIDCNSANKLQKLTAKDSQNTNCTITVTKNIAIDDVVYAHGNPTFIFKLEGTDSVGNTYTYYKNVTFDESFINNYRTADPSASYASQKVVFTDLPAGTWKVTEVDTVRYTPQVTATSSNGTLDSTNNTVTFTLSSDSKDGTATFTNVKTKQSSTTHTAQTVNIVQNRKATVIEAKWVGDDPFTQSTLDRTMVEVYVIFDDGTRVKLGDNDYNLDVETFIPGTNGVQTITASYTENGTTVTDTFEVNVSVDLNFTAEVIDTTPFTDSDGTVYAGTVALNGIIDPNAEDLADGTLVIPNSIYGYRTATHECNTSSKTWSRTSYSDQMDSNSKYKVVSVKGMSYSSGSSNYYGKIFNSDNITNVVISEGVESIGDYAFYNSGKNTKLQTVKIPDSITTIGQYAFNYCQGLKVLSFGENSQLKEIAKYAFNRCTGLTGTLTIPDTVTTIGNFAFNYCQSLTGTLTIPNNVTSIGDHAFYQCKGLTGLEIGTGLSTTGDYTFYGCSGLTGTLTIPNNVTTIGTSAFNLCSSLTELSLGTGVTSIGLCAFQDCTGLVGTLTIPDNVQSIGNGAFQRCSNLKGLDLGTGVTSIGSNAFQQCTNLTGTVVIPDSVTTLGGSAFYKCSSITGLSLGTGITSIGNSTFAYCTSLTDKVVIPGNVTSIGSSAFSNCTNANLKIRITTSVTSIGGSAFSGVAMICYHGTATDSNNNNWGATAACGESTDGDHL